MDSSNKIQTYIPTDDDKHLLRQLIISIKSANTQGLRIDGNKLIANWDHVKWSQMLTIANHMNTLLGSQIDEDVQVNIDRAMNIGNESFSPCVDIAITSLSGIPDKSIQEMQSMCMSFVDRAMSHRDTATLNMDLRGTLSEEQIRIAEDHADAFLREHGEQRISTPLTIAAGYEEVEIKGSFASKKPLPPAAQKKLQYVARFTGGRENPSLCFVLEYKIGRKMDIRFDFARLSKSIVERMWDGNFYRIEVLQAPDASGKMEYWLDEIGECVVAATPLLLNAA